jgi:hypothetical protein
LWPDDSESPTVDFTAPSEGFELAEPTLPVELSAADNTAVVAAALRVNAGPWIWLDVAPGNARIRASLAISPGAVSLEARVHDAAGNVGTAAVKGRRKAPPGTAAPTVVIAAPTQGSSTFQPSVVVRGTASDDVGVAQVTVQSVPDGPVIQAVTADAFASWEATVPLAPGRLNTLKVVARDGASAEGTAQLQVTQLGAADSTPPVLLVEAPSPLSNTLSDYIFEIRGTVSDNDAVAHVFHRIGDEPFRLAALEDGAPQRFAAFGVLREPEGVLELLAVDASGNTASFTRNLVVGAGVPWGPPREVELFCQPPLDHVVSLELDRAFLESALPPEKAEQVTILELDPGPMLLSALDVMKASCGTGWPNPDFEPVCPEEWGQAEVNMWRLLTMTPPRADVAGTSFANLAEIANVLSTYDSLIDDFATLLGVALDVAQDEPLVTSEGVAAAIRGLVVATHPNAGPDGRIPITLRDALTDMATLAPRFGPAGDHPGFLLGPTSSKVLDPDFRLSIQAQAKLHWHQGITHLGAKGAIAFVPSSATGVLDLDFLSPEAFDVQGLASDPRVDLVFGLAEHPSFVSAGTSVEPVGQGDSEVWSIPPFTIERVVATAAQADFASFRAGCSLCPGALQGALLWEIPGITQQDNDLAEVVVGEDGYAPDGLTPLHFAALNPNPAGWMRVWTVGGLGYPAGVPKFGAWTVGYVWDIVLEVAQKRLLDGGVVQGEGDVSFPLQGVSVGLTEDELVEGVRLAMDAEEEKLVELLAGSWAENSDFVDVFLSCRPDGTVWLAHAIAGDPLGPAANPAQPLFVPESMKTGTWDGPLQIVGAPSSEALPHLRHADPDALRDVAQITAAGVPASVVSQYPNGKRVQHTLILAANGAVRVFRQAEASGGNP